MKMNVRGGFTAFNNADMSVRYSKEDIYRIDTFTSSQTGQQFFVDSTRNENYYISNVYNQLALDLSATFSTNKSNKFSFYAGVGALVGFTYANYLDVMHSTGINDYYGDHSSNNHQNYNRFWSRSTENEKMKLDNAGSTVAVFIPLGVEYRLSK